MWLARAKNEDEKKYVLAVFGHPKIKASDSLADLIDVVARWRVMVSDMTADPQVLQFEAQYVYNEYGHLTVGELTLATGLYAHRMLPVAYAIRPKFSTDFISTVLEGYQAWVREKCVPLIARFNDKPPQSHKPTNKERVDTIRWFIEKVAADVHSQKHTVLFLDIVYEFLRTKKYLVLNDEIVERAREYSARKIKELTESEFYHKPKKQWTMNIKTEKESAGRRFGMLYVLRDYFAHHPVEALIRKVSEKDFDDEKIR